MSTCIIALGPSAHLLIEGECIVILRKYQIVVSNNQNQVPLPLLIRLSAQMH